MALQLGDEAPNFRAETTQGPIDFHEWIGGSWCIFFSHPGDYTPVCTTELGQAAKMKQEFEKRNTRMIAISVDPLEDHFGWINDINETQKTTVNYPIIADPDRKVANLYQMIHPNASETATVRSVFIIGPDKKIKLVLVYPMTVGRNFDEVLRVIDSLQLGAKHKVATPAQWKQGDDVIIAGSVTDDDAKKLFPQGWKSPKPYIRIVPQPK